MVPSQLLKLLLYGHHFGRRLQSGTSLTIQMLQKYKLILHCFVFKLVNCYLLLKRVDIRNGIFGPHSSLFCRRNENMKFTLFFRLECLIFVYTVVISLKRWGICINYLVVDRNFLSIIASSFPFMIY